MTNNDIKNVENHQSKIVSKRRETGSVISQEKKNSAETFTSATLNNYFYIIC